MWPYPLPKLRAFEFIDQNAKCQFILVYEGTYEKQINALVADGTLPVSYGERAKRYLANKFGGPQCGRV